MADESKNGGTAITATMNLETYLAKNGPMPWRECLAQIHDVCFDLEKDTDHSKIGDLTIRSFVVKPTGTASGIKVEKAAGNVPTDNVVLLAAHAVSFPDEAYMSPERCLNKDVDRRADIYSLGCLMYHMLTGSPPFTHRDSESQREAQTIEYALPPGRRSQRRFIPDEVDSLVSRCLEKDPTKRFKSPGELRASIGNALQIEEDPEEEIARSSKFAEFFAKKQKVFIGVACLVVVTAALGYLSLQTTSSDQFTGLINRSIDRRRNKWFLNLEHGPMYTAQAEFGNGKMEPPPEEEPLILKCRDQDIMLFATTKRKTVKDALEEAIRRKLIMFKINLAGDNLKGITIPGGNLPQAFAMETNLEGASLEGCNLKEANFYDADLKDANLQGAFAERAVFQKANLENANLRNAVLIDCDFKDANLKNANLEHSYLLNARFTGADITGVNLTGATLTNTAAQDAKLTAEQMKTIKLVEGPKDDRKGVRKTTAPVGPGEESRNNPFIQPERGGAFGIPDDAPIGLNIPKVKPGESIPIKPLPRKNPNAVPQPQMPHSAFPTAPPPKPGTPNQPLPA